MNKKISLGAAIAFMAIVAMATLAITMAFSKRMFNDTVYDLTDREKRYSKLAEVDDLVRQNYIGTVDQEKLTNSLIKGFIEGIGDPNAKYYDAAQYARLQNEYNNKSVQIGVVTRMDESGYIKVSDVYPDSPAQAAGIEAEDLIVKIDDTDITSENYTQATMMLLGEPGTKMTIVLRKGTEDTTLEMTRRFVEVPSVSASMLENRVGLITIKEFNDSTPSQFIKQVDALIDQDAAALIFDVRNVNTGTLSSVAQVMDKLMTVESNDKALISSIDKDGNITVLETADGREVALPMAVLINEKTTGEAELFAITLHDIKKSPLVGVKTAGKGTLQRLLPLQDGSGAIWVTTARFKPPVSPSFDGEGVTPDYEVKMSEDQAALAQTSGAEYDLQLKKAIEVMTATARTQNTLPDDVSSTAEETESADEPSEDTDSSEEDEASSGADEESEAENSDEESSQEDDAQSDAQTQDDDSSEDASDTN